MGLDLARCCYNRQNEMLLMVHKNEMRRIFRTRLILGDN